MKAGGAWLAAGLGWLAGCAWQLQMAALWPSPWAALLLAKAAVLLVVAWRFRQQLPGVLAVLVAAALLGFGATHLRAESRLADALAPELEGQDLVVTGVISGLPREGLQGTRFVLDTESATHQGRPVAVPARLSLGWYRGVDEDLLLAGPSESLRAGQRWRLTLRLKQPHGLFNPHGFDLELWLFEQGLRAGGYVRAKAGAPGEGAVKLAEGQGHAVDRLRQAVREGIQARVADATTAGVLAALAIGDQAAIERDDWDLFRATGVAHLMSISGLHVTMFAWLAAALVRRLWRTQPRWMLAVPAPTAARWGGLVAALLYALLAGWGVPAQRTVWMIATVAVLQQAGLRWPLLPVLLCAAVVVAALDPWALLQPGFWLSFVAVALLVVSEPASAQVPSAEGWWARLRAAAGAALRTQVVATVGLAPLSLVFFQQLSLVGFVANLVAIPVVTLLITPLALLGVVLPPLWPLGAWCVAQLGSYLQVLTQAPWAVWQSAVAPPWAMAAGLLGALLAVLPLPGRLRLLALPLMLPLLAPPLQRPPPGQIELVVADVGQGTAVLLRTANHLLVYDTGPQYNPDADAGGRVLVPLLHARGETLVDLLMLSHRDTDHVGGAATLLRALPVREIRSSLADEHGLRQAGPPHGRCEAGQRWAWDGVQFEVLRPDAEDYMRQLRSNAMSCVLRVQPAQGPVVLLTGDLEAAQEAQLVARNAAALKADVLLVPHHGSRTSSTPTFLDAVAPRLALVQAGYRSRYGHPAPDVMARYAERGITVLRSDRCGAWQWQAGQPQCARAEWRRYWHHPGGLRSTPPSGEGATGADR